MIALSAIQCRNVGSIENAKFEFAKGLNLVFGKNEAGKSTLIKAMAYTLFGADDQSLKPEGFTGDYGAAVKLETDSGEFIIDRNFADNGVTIFKLKDGTPQKEFTAKVSPRGRSADVKAYQGRLKKIIGFADRDLFEACALHLQQDMGLGKEEAVRKIKQILAGQATHDYDAVVDGLTARYFDITAVNPDGRNKTKPRQLERLETELEAVAEKRDQAVQGHQRCIELQEAIEQGNVSIERMNTKIASTDRLVNVAADYFKYDQEIDELELKHKSMSQERQKVRDLGARIEIINKEVAELGMAADIDDSTAGKMRECISLEERLVQQKVLADQAMTLLETGSEKTNTWIIFAILAALCFIGAGFLLSVHFLFTIAGAILGGFIAFGAMNLKKKKAAQIQRLRAGFDLAKADLDRLEAGVDSISIPDNISAMGTAAFEKLLTDREKSIISIRDREKCQAQIDVLLPLAQIEDALSVIERKIAVLGERQDELKRTHTELEDFDHDKLVSHMAQLNDLEQQLEKIKTMQGEDRQAYAALSAVTENPDSLNEQIEDYTERISVVKQRRDAVAEAISAVKEAVREYRGEYLTDFSKEVGGAFAKLVGDRKRKVILDNDMVPALSTAKGAMPLELLSAGTRDQLYFAARVALAGKLAEGVLPPLILDDPFTNFDSDRLKNTVHLLEALSKDHQVIIFSHDEQLALLVEQTGNLIHMNYSQL